MKNFRNKGMTYPKFLSKIARLIVKLNLQREFSVTRIKKTNLLKKLIVFRFLSKFNITRITVEIPIVS